MAATSSMINPTPSVAESLVHRPADEAVEGPKRRARFRLYIGAAPGAGKSDRMLEDAHELRRQGIDVVIGFLERHGRPGTTALVADLEQVPARTLAYPGGTLQEMDVAAIKARRPRVAIVDELAHTNAPGATHQKRYEDVLELLTSGIDVISTANIQHIESLNEAIAAATGVRVRETIPDRVLQRADEVINVDVSVEMLLSRVRQGTRCDPQKIDEALRNFFLNGNLTALCEVALRELATDQADSAPVCRAHNLEQAVTREKVMVAMASHGSARTLLRLGSRIARRRATDWFAVYVSTPKEEPGRISPADHVALADNMRLARELGATAVTLKSSSVPDALVDFARREGISHVIFGQSARSRWNLRVRGSIVDRFLRDVRNATVQVVPIKPLSLSGDASLVECDSD